MSDIKAYLPTPEALQTPFPEDIDAQKVSERWLDSFSKALEAKDVSSILSLFHPDAWWRDLFALTWDLRTFQGAPKIQKFVEERVTAQKVSGIKLESAKIAKPFPDLPWVEAQFKFETDVIEGTGVVRLVPTPEGSWKAFVISTNLESLKGHPEKIGPYRNFQPSHGKWLDQRKREQEFTDGDPEVLIVGGGQSGLDVAARLKNLGISNLVIEKQDRIGDQWRNRYSALCLHDPVWFDHMPYLPFPPSWPVYTPAQKLADWLEFFAEALEINVWTSSLVNKAYRDEDANKWVVTIRKKDGSERELCVDHLIFSLGLGGGAVNIPGIPGREEFQGQVLHSTQHRHAKDHIGKKVVIVGACTSAHDIAADYVEHGVDVTIFQRSSTYVMTTKEGMPRLMSPLYWEGGPPVEEADRLANSLPVLFSKLLQKRTCVDIHNADKPLVDALHKVGYKTNYGDDGSGFLYLALSRIGGYYLDVGACQLIIDGKIKIKNDAQIERFTKTGLKFTNGTTLDADVVLYATGFSDARDPIRQIVPEDIGKRLPPIWGLNDEGEVRSVWRELGTPGLWYMMGNLAGCRFFSKHLALQIKAKKEGLFTDRYAVPLVY